MIDDILTHSKVVHHKKHERMAGQVTYLLFANSCLPSKAKQNGIRPCFC